MKMPTRMRPSTDDEPLRRVDVESAGDERRADLEEREREADGDREGEDELPARELEVLLVVLGLRGVVRRDRERAEADGERLAERDDAADDREPVDPAFCHRRGDHTADLRDLAVRLADGHRPVRRRAHHHALEDGLPSDGHAQRS